MPDRRLRLTSITVASIIFYAIGLSELLGGALLLITPIELNRGLGVLTLLLGAADMVGGYCLWRREMSIALVLCVIGIFSEGVNMLFIPLLIKASLPVFIYAFAVLIGYIIILILIASNWRALLKNI